MEAHYLKIHFGYSHNTIQAKLPSRNVLHIPARNQAHGSERQTDEFSYLIKFSEEFVSLNQTESFTWKGH